MYKITPREALQIQARQAAYYAHLFPQIHEIAAHSTNIDGLDMETHYPIDALALRIPRGWALGALVGADF